MPDANGAAELDGLAVELGNLVRRSRQYTRRRAVRLDPNLHPLGYVVITVLRREGAIPQRVLGEQLLADKSVLSRTIRDLEALGLVERTPDPNDGRASVVSLTEYGVQRCNEVRAADRTELQERLTDWSAEDLAALVGLLQRLNHSLAEEQ